MHLFSLIYPQWLRKVFLRSPDPSRNLDTVLFKIYYEDKGKLSKLLNKVTAITTNGISDLSTAAHDSLGVEWGEPQKTKDERGEDCVYIRYFSFSIEFRTSPLPNVFL